MRPMNAGTSLSEAALGRPSLLQAAVCYPSLLEAAVVTTSLSKAGTSTEHRHTSSRRPAPAPGTQHPAPCLHQRAQQSPPHALPAHSTGTGARCLYHAHCQHPAPAPCVHHAHSQLTAPAPAPSATTSTSNLSLPRAQPAHKHQHRHPAPSTSTSNLSPPHAQPAHSTSTGTRHPAPSTSNLSPPRAQQHQHRHPAPSNLSRKRARATHCYLKYEPHSFAIWGKRGWQGCPVQQMCERLTISISMLSCFLQWHRLSPETMASPNIVAWH